jgi:hypothetical protein
MEMRFEFRQTADDQREAIAAHAAASTRLRAPTRWTGIIWRFGTAFLVALIISIADPFTLPRIWGRRVVWLIAMFVPWISVLGFVVWVQITAVRVPAIEQQPWESPGKIRRTPGGRNSRANAVRLGIGGLVAAIVLIAFGLFGLSYESADRSNLFIFGLGA